MRTDEFSRDSVVDSGPTLASTSFGDLAALSPLAVGSNPIPCPLGKKEREYVDNANQVKSGNWI